jgi:hypothetical protein
MPYSNPKQAQAVFLSIKREKGEAAAKRWGRKHRDDLSKAARYTPRSERSR